MCVFFVMECYINSVCLYVWIPCLFDLVFFHTKSQHVMSCHVMSVDFAAYHVRFCFASCGFLSCQFNISGKKN